MAGRAIVNPSYLEGPGVFAIDGVFLFHFGFITTILIDRPGQLVGCGNAMFPNPVKGGQPAKKF